MVCDTNDPECSPASQVKGAVLRKTAQASDTSCTFGVPGTTFTSDQLAINLGVPTNALRFDNSLEWLKEFRRALYLSIIHFWYQKYTIQSQRQSRRGQALWGSQIEVFLIVSVLDSIASSWLWGVIILRVLPTRDAHLIFSVQSFGGGFHCIGMVDGIPGKVTVISLQPQTSLGDGPTSWGLKPQSSTHRDGLPQPPCWVP